MAKQNKRRPKNNKMNGFSILDNAVNKLILSMDDEIITDDNLDAKDAELKSLLTREMELARGISGGSIIDFNKTLNQDKNKGGKEVDLDTRDDLGDYIVKNSGSIYQYFSERNRNKFVENKDLNFIAKFIPSITQAINLYVTHIISSDDLSGFVKRNLYFGSALSESESTVLTKSLTQFEKENKLLNKLKNLIITNTLISGEYYVYAPSYKKLFTDYQKTLNNAKKNSGIQPSLGEDKSYFNVSESTNACGANEWNISLDASNADVCNMISNFDLDTNNKFDSISKKKDIVSNMSSVSYIESPIPAPVFEDIPGLLEAAKEDAKFKSILDKCLPAIEASTKNKRLNGVSDGTYNIKGKNNEDSQFNITGTYLKFIDAKNIIKVKILDETIGYFYVDSKRAAAPKNAVTFSNGEWSNISKQSSVEKLADMLSDKVAKQFNPKFVSDHVEFKKLIADCIMANGIINKQYRIQFIPTEDMFEFKIGTNGDDDGTSILSNGLWAAKILASIRIRKTLNYVNKSGNKTVAYVKRGSADISGRNQTQRILRNMQESNITFGDIIGDSALMFHKYAADGTILMPTSKAGNKLVEFETMEGQTVDMSTEYEKDLENQILISMGVSPLLIDQTNNAEFSKAFTSSHIGFAGNVASLQTDFEEPTTALYKRIIENLDITDSIKNKVIPIFEFRLPRPKALSCTNNNEILDAAANFADKFANLKYGDVDDSNKEKIKRLKFEIVKDKAPFVDWDHLEEIVKNVELEVSEVTNDSNSASDDSEMDEDM